MLTISAKDFGPIIEGTVDLKPLTVFVGPSNTGKSYMATLIYALMQARATGRTPPYVIYNHFLGSMRIPGITIRPSVILDEEKTGLEEAVVSWANQVDIGDQEMFSFSFNSLNYVMRELVGEMADKFLRSSVESFTRELQRFHGEVIDFRRHSSDISQVSFSLSQEQPSLIVSVGESGDHSNIEMLKQSIELSNLDLQMPSFFIRDLKDVLPDGDYHSGYRRPLDFVHSLTWNAVTNIFRELLVSSYYLPAARSGIAQGHRIIASTLIRQSPFAGVQRMEIPQFSGVIADFMSHLLTIGQVTDEEISPALQESIEFLQREVVRGEIDLEETGELTYPEIYYEPFRGQPSTGKFTLNQTSSMVSELAPIILFLKYLVRPGDLLILEEPESHLHPAAQRQMARGIVRLVNAGVKVLITTHSDYLVSQVNNLMRISFASDRWLKREGFTREDCLKHDDVSAYAFEWDDAEGGSRVRELEIRKDVGIDEDEFGLVANDLYEETILVERIRPK